MFARILSTGVAVALAGCLANPATGVRSNGDPLRVRYSSGTGTYTKNEVVSTDVYRDSDGNEVGSKDTYQPVTHTFRWRDTNYFQGREEIDEHDFFRLAGDGRGADEIQKIRDGAALKQKIGVPLMVVGLAATMVLTTVARSTDNPNLATVGYSGGSIIGTAGAAIWFWGRNTMKKRSHISPARTDRNADIIQICDEGRCRSQRGGRQAAR